MDLFAGLERTDSVVACFSTFVFAGRSVLIRASLVLVHKYFEKEHVKGVFLYDTIEEAVDILLKIKKMSADEIDSLEKANRRFFLQELSVSKMYLNYKNFLNSINLNK